jgi:hypothetical protein
VKRVLAITLLLLTTSCGLGPDKAACESHRQELERMQADLDAAAEQRQDLAPYVAAIAQARRVADAAGC